jgi:putative transposase
LFITRSWKARIPAPRPLDETGSSERHRGGKPDGVDCVRIVHFMRNALAHAGKTQRRMVSAAIGTVFVQESADAAQQQWRSVADQLRGKLPKLGTLMDEAEHDVLAFMTFPRAHWPQIYSTNPLERLNAEIKRRTNVVGIFPNDASVTRLVGAMLLEQNDEWSLNRRYMQIEGLQALSDTAPTRLPAVAR